MGGGGGGAGGGDMGEGIGQWAGKEDGYREAWGGGGGYRDYWGGGVRLRKRGFPECYNTFGEGGV